MKTGPHDGDIFTLCNVIRETSFESISTCAAGMVSRSTRTRLRIGCGKRASAWSNKKRSRSLTKTAPASGISKRIY